MPLTAQKKAIITPFAAHGWKKLRDTPVGKTAAGTLLLARHLRSIIPLIICPRGSNLHAFVRARPEILQMVYSPYVAANWDVPERFARIINHCKTVAAIGGVFDFPPDIVVDVLRLNSIDPELRVTLDQPRWLLRDGQLALSLWYGIDRIFHLSFCLACENGRRFAFIGGLQGRRESSMVGSDLDVLEIYRRFTHAASGMRPRDFILETFRIVCRILDVVEIRAVSNANHPQRRIFDDVKLSYNEVWLERGGVDEGNGFFILPVASKRRVIEEIAAKKRSLYRQRYAMLDAVDLDLRNRIGSTGS